MHNLIRIDFKNKSIIHNQHQLIDETVDPLDMFEQFDFSFKCLQARFGENLPKHIVEPYVPNFKDFMFDTYGHGNVHSSKHQYQPTKKERETWNKPGPILSDLRSIDKFFSSLEPGSFAVLGLKSDPFQWLDQKYKSTRNTLKLANKYKIKLQLNTMSDLCAHDEYIQLIKAGDHTVNMNMGIEGLTEEQERVLSPGAPSLKRRQIAIDKLRDSGVDFFITIKRKAG